MRLHWHKYIEITFELLPCTPLVKGLGTLFKTLWACCFGRWQLTGRSIKCIFGNLIVKKKTIEALTALYFQFLNSRDPEKKPPSALWTTYLNPVCKRVLELVTWWMAKKYPGQFAWKACLWTCTNLDRTWNSTIFSLRWKVSPNSVFMYINSINNYCKTVTLNTLKMFVSGKF